MEIGVAIFATDDALDPASVARLAEERGYESLFFPEHSHIPAARLTPYRGGGDLPRRYWRTYDLFVALAAAATATRRLRIGSGICLVVQRDPIYLAKETASIDHLSGGRFEFGVGAGWNREEMLNHGTDPKVRMHILRERIEAVKVIWSEAEASYRGRYVNFEGICSWPKPLQRPHPPILVGGRGPTVFDRVLSYGDGWFPNHAGDVIERSRELLARADRRISLQVMGVPADPHVLEAYEKAGFDRAVHWLPSAKRSVIERAMDDFERAVAEYRGH
ncbi:luciferase family protein [Acidothermus cellulolyticus 11B]|uniref:Luciferase family protein n=1 Tax=Acidothermus cellulolyticus (strain ATCC 43068 / DSM 8971 / 11B) TaxID=351607 RepID=A0LUX7_ACIC1|nr:LLM class F420-dependent oxidoreductase [Acidothermus cellulolyticus]ABK53237.1 luciferase family protein [Acidothermus cellulolyticus 11B]